MIRKKAERKTYDKVNMKPILKCSICNGEQVAGFKDLRTGKFEEVALICSGKDLIRRGGRFRFTKERFRKQIRRKKTKNNLAERIINYINTFLRGF